MAYVTGHMVIRPCCPRAPVYRTLCIPTGYYNIYVLVVRPSVRPETRGPGWPESTFFKRPFLVAPLSTRDFPLGWGGGVYFCADALISSPGPAPSPDLQGSARGLSRARTPRTTRRCSALVVEMR